MNTQTQPVRVIVIDDNPEIHRDVEKTLCRSGGDQMQAAAAKLFGGRADQVVGPSFEVDSAAQGEEGYNKVVRARAEGRPYRVAFTDVRMPPGWDGIETTERMFQADPELQVVLCTAYSDYTITDITKRFRESDRLLILKKPFDIAEVTLMATALSTKWRLARESRWQLEQQYEQIVDLQSVLSLVEDARTQLKLANDNLKDKSITLSDELQQRTVEVFRTREIAALAMAQLAESRDPETGEHLARMQAFAQLIAGRLAHGGPYASVIDEGFLEDFYRSTPLHDIGKVGIPDAVLLKPGPLTASEFDLMKRHTLIGAHALEAAISGDSDDNFLTMAAEVARSHHERWDGAGYPVGLRGESIPLAARISSVADVFDALTADRVYKDAIPPEEARGIIADGAGSQFDPHVVDAFLDCYEEIVAERDRINQSLPQASATAEV